MCTNQYTIHYEGNHFLVHGHKQDLPHITCIFHLLKYEVNFLVSAILHHISMLRLLPKSYFKIILSRDEARHSLLKSKFIFKYSVRMTVRGAINYSGSLQIPMTLRGVFEK